MTEGVCHWHALHTLLPETETIGYRDRGDAIFIVRAWARFAPSAGLTAAPDDEHCLAFTVTGVDIPVSDPVRLTIRECTDAHCREAVVPLSIRQ